MGRDLDGEHGCYNVGLWVCKAGVLVALVEARHARRDSSQFTAKRNFGLLALTNMNGGVL